jgi:hypothetical protein
VNSRKQVERPEFFTCFAAYTLVLQISMQSSSNKETAIPRGVIAVLMSAVSVDSYQN